jgi:hypothetical protein
MPGILQHISVQLTPPNIAFLMTYLSTVTARRDLVGSTTLCKSIVHSQAMQEYEQVARIEDMWDVNCRLEIEPADRSSHLSWPRRCAGDTPGRDDHTS